MVIFVAKPTYHCSSNRKHCNYLCSESKEKYKNLEVKFAFYSPDFSQLRFLFMFKYGGPNRMQLSIEDKKNSFSLFIDIVSKCSYVDEDENSGAHRKAYYFWPRWFLFESFSICCQNRHFLAVKKKVDILMSR